MRPRPAADEILTRAIDGQRDAVAVLVARHGPALWALCRRMDRHPEDAYQEVWERVLRNLAGFDPLGAASLATWMRTLATRLIIDRHRRRSVRGEVVALPELPQPGDPHDELERRRRHQALETAVLALPDAQRRAVVLHHLEGLDLMAIAELEGVAPGTVKSRLHRGRAQLAVYLGATP